MENKNNLAVLGFILGASLIVSTAIGAYSFYKIRTQDYLSTTGSAKKIVTSDKVKWTSTITRVVKLTTVKTGYAQMDADLKEVKAFLSQNGIVEADISVNPIYMQEIYDNSGALEKNYNLVQNIEVQSNDVNKIAGLAKDTSLVVTKGILFATQSLEYYYSKLPEARVELLASAVADAKARAAKLAEAGGKSIGALKSASSGVVQVLSPNSAEVTDYGSYNTSTIEKEIMITVKASFEIR